MSARHISTTSLGLACRAHSARVSHVPVGLLECVLTPVATAATHGGELYGVTLFADVGVLFDLLGYLFPVRADLLSDPVGDSADGRYARTLVALFERGIHRPLTVVWEHESFTLAETFRRIITRDAAFDALSTVETEIKRLEAENAGDEWCRQT